MNPWQPRTWSLDRRLLTLLLCAPLLGLIGVIVGELVPDGRIGYHLLRAEEAGIVTPDERTPSVLGTTTDHYSECVAITVGLGDPRGAGLLERALRSPAYYGCEQMSLKLQTLAETDRLAPGWTYLRYWHGYAVISRPAIGILGVAGARWVAFGILAVAVGGLAAAVGKRLGWVATVLLVAPAALSTDMIVGGLTLSQAIGMSTAWCAGWLALVLVERRPEWRTALLVGALAGAINAYFDLMTTIPGSLALTATGIVIGAVSSGNRRERWRLLVAGLAGWGVGIVGMWVAKWVIAAAVLGYDEVDENVRDQIEFRLSGDYEGVSTNRTRGFTDNLAEWWSEPLTPWLIVASIATLVVALWKARRPDVGWGEVGACVGLIAVPTAAWYAVLNNHSQIHSWLVYRSLAMAFGGIITVVWALAVRHRDAADLADLADLDDTPTWGVRSKDGTAAPSVSSPP